MRHIWQLLELDPQEVDEKKVRQAYARLLKVHRPDQDPQGFQRLRSAYEQALEWLKWRQNAVDDEGDETTEAEDGETFRSSRVEWSTEKPLEPVKAPENPAPGPLAPSWGDGGAPELPHEAKGGEAEPKSSPVKKEPTERHWPRDWSFGIEALQRACLRAEEEPEGVSKALTAFLWDVREHGILNRDMETILRDAFDGKMELLARTIPSAFLCELISQENMRLVEELWSRLQPGARVHFAQKLEQCPHEVYQEGSVAFLIHAACFVALESPKVAQSLNVLLHRLPKGIVNQEMKDRLRVLIHRGTAFLKLPSAARAFWNHRIARPEEICDWSAPDVEDVLEATVLLGKQWAGLDHVQKVVPPAVLERASSSLLPRKMLRALRSMMTRDFLVTSGFSLLAGVLLFFGAVKLQQMREAYLARALEKNKAEKQPAVLEKKKMLRDLFKAQEARKTSN